MSKSRRKLERYLRAVAMMRLYQDVGEKLVTAMSEVLPQQDVTMLERAINDVTEITFTAEEKMYREFPEVGEKYPLLFYGLFDDTTLSDVETTAHITAEEVTDAVFNRA